jgi:sugar lactone lactonase YvrE
MFSKKYTKKIKKSIKNNNKTNNKKNKHKNKKNTKKRINFIKKNINLVGGAGPDPVPQRQLRISYTYKTTLVSTGSIGKINFNLPRSIAVTIPTNSVSPNSTVGMCLADTNNNCIQIFTGDIQTETYCATNYADTLGSRIKGNKIDQFNIPEGVAIDANNRIYVVDTANNRIQVFDENKKYIITIGLKDENKNLTYPKNLKNPKFMNFKNPKGVAFSPTGDLLYIADTGNHRIQIFNVIISIDSIDYTYFKTLGSEKCVPGKTNDLFNNPSSVAISTIDNKIYISDTGNNRIKIYNKDNQEYIFLSLLEGFFNNPIGIAVSIDNIIYVADSKNHRIAVFNGNSTINNYITTLGTIYSAGNDNTKFNNPCGVAVSAECVYIADTTNNRVQVFSINPPNYSEVPPRLVNSEIGINPYVHIPSSRNNHSDVPPYEPPTYYM